MGLACSACPTGNCVQILLSWLLTGARDHISLLFGFLVESRGECSAWDLLDYGFVGVYRSRLLVLLESAWGLLAYGFVGVYRSRLPVLLVSVCCNFWCPGC